MAAETVQHGKWGLLLSIISIFLPVCYKKNTIDQNIAFQK